MSNGAPTGALVMNGVVYHDANRPYFAILNDGTAVIRTGNVTSDVREAVGGSAIMLKNGEIPNFTDGYYVGKEPRTAVGIKADGSVVLFVGDGRQYPKSSGLTIYELAKMMKALGCVEALNLDGGGSSTFLTEREGESDLVLHNSPSDGPERTVSSSLFVYSTAKADGIFDHAVLAPNNEAYTPYSSVQFSAKGVDKTGSNADMPSNVTYTLDASSTDLGSISEDGLFVSNGNVGTVTVNLMCDGKVVGSTSVDMIAPDSITFTNDEVSLGFSAESDLGLVIKAGGRDINCKAGDFEWTMSDDSMGTFDGNIFTSSDSATVTGTITCAYKYDKSVFGTVTAIIGKLPTVVWDFENPEEYTGLYTSNYNRGSIQSAEIVSIDDDEPVRFGKNSLKLNYNFINCGAVTEGACVGMTDVVEIPGVPTGIGVWVYAPEGTAPSAEEQAAGYSGFWLRGYFTDGGGRTQAFDYTLEPKQCTNGQKPGIYWEGWQYCEADLTKYTAPYSIQPGMTFRLMYVAGTKMGTKSAGAIYFDNLQFVYGANVDDVDLPAIDTIRGNDIEIVDGTVFDTNTITFTSTFHDVQNKYTSGIDYDVVRMYIDGQNVVDDAMYVLDKGGNKSWYYDVELANGVHSIKMLVKDTFGNETTETRFFSVDAKDNEATTMTLAPVEGTVPTLGKQFSLNLTASNVKDIKNASVGVKVPDNFKLDAVTFADGFEGTYSVKSKILNVTVNGSAATDSNVIATITYSVPATLSKGIPFSFYTTLGTFETVSESSKTNSFAVSEVKYDVVASLNIVADTFVVGKEGTILVTDVNGSPVAGATVYKVDETKTVIGVTDENGMLVTDVFSQASGKYVVSAVSEANGETYYSFNTIVYAYNDVAAEKPFNILSNATVNGNSEKNITWMSKSGVEGQAIVKVALASEYVANGEAAFASYVGSYEDRTFDGGSQTGYTAVRVNSVVVKGLEAGNEYVYCVGDGNAWSDVERFTIDAKDNKLNFFIIGDIQAKDLENNTKVINGILGKKSSYAFGIQTGDAVDAGNNYGYWNELISSFDANGLQNIDLVHALGNHEYEGDEKAANAASIYNLPDSDMYSMEYDNLYVAVINYKSADNAVLENTGKWLVEDAKKSSAQWKIVVMHQPPYFTNIAGGGNYINENLPKYLEEAGINMVFSGHDHTLARTLPMIGGQVDEDGIVYYICGSTGEKSYAAFETPEFNFAYTNDTFDAVYTTVEVSEEAIKVVNYDLDGSILDSYTMGSKCAKDGHDYIYNGSEIVCEKCGKSEDVDTFIGFVKDSTTEKAMYIFAGEIKTGLLELGDAEYLFDEKGLAIDGEYSIDRMSYMVDNGLVVTKNGFERYYSSRFKRYYLRMFVDGKLVQDAGWMQYNGEWYYVDGNSVCTSTKTIDGVMYRFNSDGTHTKGTFKDNGKGIRYYFAGEMKTGLQTIEGNTYYFNTKSGYKVVSKEMEIDGMIYTFDENGIAISIVEKPTKPETGFWKENGQTFYYLDGEMVMNDWVTVEEGTFFFDGNGYMVTKTSIIDNAVCKFNADGTLASKESLDTYDGFLTIDGKTFLYETGSMVLGWKNVDGDWYYFLPDTGVMNNRAKTIDGVYYKFSSDGKLIGGTFKTNKNGTRYFVAGSAVTGLYDIDGATYYFDKNGYLKKNVEVTIGNIIYTIDENGIVIKTEEKPSKPSTGFWKEDGYTYYFIDNVMVANQWVELESGKYYFDEAGHMVTTKLVTSYAIFTFNADGTLAEVTDLTTYDGWLTVDGETRYYDHGSMVYGWNCIDGVWYYFHDGMGYLYTRSATIDGVRYIINSDGSHTVGTWKTNTKGTRYYFAGEYKTGLQTIDGNLYYFASNGYLVKNTTKTINDVTYVFDENGVGSVYVEPEVEVVEEEAAKAEEVVTEEEAVEETAEETVVEEAVADEAIEE